MQKKDSSVKKEGTVLNSKADFSKGSIKVHILRLALPITVAQLVNVVYNLVDRIYLGRLNQTNSLALTGVGVCLPITIVIMAFAMLVGSGGSPLFSIERGKGDEKEASMIMGNSFSMIIIMGFFLTVIGFVVKEPVLYALGASEQTYQYANQYLTIYLFGCIFSMVTTGMSNFITAQGRATISMMTGVVGALVNIVLDPIFIFILNFGVAGAALATVISQAISAVITLWFFNSKKAIIKLSKKSMRLKPKRIKRICVLGLSGFTMSATTSIVQMVSNSTLQSFGGDIFVGAMTIISSVREVFQTLIVGITGSAQPILGFNYGARQMERVKKCIRFVCIITIVYTVAVWAIIFVSPEFFLRLFTEDANMIKAAVPCMHIYFFGFFSMAMQFSGQTIFLALGKAKQAITFSLLRKIILVLPLILVLPHIFDLGVRGVFLAEPISSLLGGSTCFLTMMLTVYRKLGKENFDV